MLCTRLCTWNQILPHWSKATIVTTPAVTATDSPSMSLYTVKCMRPPYSAEVTFTVIINYDQTWTLTLGFLPISLAQIPAAPIRLLHCSEVLPLLVTLDSLKLCIGNPESEYVKLIEEKGSLTDRTGIISNTKQYLLLTML